MLEMVSLLAEQSRPKELRSAAVKGKPSLVGVVNLECLISLEAN